MMNDIPCKCGHLILTHTILYWDFKPDNPSQYMQNACYEKATMPSNDLLCKCNEYKPDNLKYLEHLYESRAISN